MPSKLFSRPMQQPSTQQMMPANQPQNPMGQIGDAMQMVKQLKAMSSDPMVALKMAASNNPQMKMVLDIINAFGGNPRLAAEQLLKAKGVDIAQLRSMFKL